MRHAVRLAHAQHGAFFLLVGSLSVFRKIGSFAKYPQACFSQNAILRNSVVRFCSPRCAPCARTARLTCYGSACAPPACTLTKKGTFLARLAGKIVESETFYAEIVGNMWISVDCVTKFHFATLKYTARRKLCVMILI
jgi:hypothetical protein